MSNNELVGFESLVREYQQNKDKPWHEWLEVDQIFPKPGKQGLVGLLRSKQSNNLYVFKLSQYINYLSQHELSIMKSLNRISPFCPHFCKGVGEIVCHVDPKCRKEGNPFILSTKYPIEKEIILTEYIDKSKKFANFIRAERVNENILFSTVKQTLLAIAIAQKYTKFTHYDLHSNNIMMKKCNRDLVMMYVFDENNQYCVPTMGYYPIVIDFGFAYADNLDDGPLWPTLGHTEVGFMSNRFDPIADPKLFLITVAREMEDRKKTQNIRKFINIVRNLYKHLKPDWDSGWDKCFKKSATDYVADMVVDLNDESELFKEYIYHCLDLIQSLIILPLHKQRYDDLSLSYNGFVNEFSKIEKEIGNPFYNLYILKGIVDVARDVSPDYRYKSSRNHALSFFRRSIFSKVDSIAKYCQLKTVDFDKMLCSLLCLARGIEGVLYDCVSSQMSKKEKMYAKLPVYTPEQIFAVLDVNIDSGYNFNDKTIVLVQDCIQKKSYFRKLTSKQSEEINSYDPISHGVELYKMIK